MYGVMKLMELNGVRNVNKSPFNYIGNKYQILGQLLTIFPKDVNHFVDFFAGGCDVCTNFNANHKLAIDINTYVIEILKEFQNHSLEEILNFIYKRIDEFQLSKINEEGYLKYREAYNTNPAYHTPLDLYTLSRYSFHFTIRFNNDLKMNAGFGRGYSNFSARQQKSIAEFHKEIQKVQMINIDFRDFSIDNYNEYDFFYFDPPYLITNNVYNNGVPKAWQRWEEKDERDLLDYISKCNDKGIRFALSNVIYHRGKTNTILEQWIHDNHFNLYNINNDGYSHCTHTVPQDGKTTQEIVVTNYGG